MEIADEKIFIYLFLISHLIGKQVVQTRQMFVHEQFQSIFNLSPFNITGGQMLQLPRARAEDAGQYVCTASNSAGQDQKSLLLSVYGESSAHAGFIHR